MAGRNGVAVVFSDEVTSTGSAQPLYPLGAIRHEVTGEDSGTYTYRYVIFDNGAGNIAAASGAVAYRGKTQADFWEVTTDVSDVDSAFACGVFQSVLTDAYYGWVLTKGYITNLRKKTGSGFGWTKGDYLFAAGEATDDGKAARVKLAATTKVTGAEFRAAVERGVGFAAATVSSTTATGAAYINLEN